MALKIEKVLSNWVASPPIVYTQLQKAISDPESTYDDFSRIISSDPALSVRILKIVNSPFYGFSSRVETITHALSILGNDMLSELALATGVMSKFEGIPKDLLDMDSFWRHSIACGLASKLIAEKKRASNIEQYYLTGMLHDLGFLILCKESPNKALEVLNICRARDENLFKVESEMFGFNHADIGGALMRDWKLPQRFEETVGFHHKPSKAKKYPLFVSIVHVADILVYEMELGNSGEPGIPELNPRILKFIGLSENDLQELKERIKGKFDSAVGAFL